MATIALDEQQDVRVGADNEDYESYNELGLMTEDRNLGTVNITSDDYWTPVNLPPNSSAYKRRIQYLIHKIGALVEHSGKHVRFNPRVKVKEFVVDPDGYTSTMVLDHKGSKLTSFHVKSAVYS